MAIHRDLEPANVRAAPELGVAGLAFGLAEPANDSRLWALSVKTSGPTQGIASPGPPGEKEDYGVVLFQSGLLATTSQARRSASSSI